MRTKTLLATLTLLVLLPAAAIAQTTIDTAPPAQTGQQVYGSYFSSDVDTVGLYNGNLMLNIGLFSLPGREIPLGLSLSYNNQKYQTLWWSDGSAGFVVDAYTIYTGGWRIANPFGDDLQVGVNTSDLGWDEVDTCFWTGTFVAVWIDAVGTKHTYTKDDGFMWACSEEPELPAELFDYGNYTEMLLDSVDGDRSQVFFGMGGTPGAQIAFADGSFLTFTYTGGNYKSAKWISRNGNYLEKATNGSKLPTQDTLGRTIGYTAGSWSGGYLSDVYTIVDSSGTNRSYTITYKTMTVFSAVNTPHYDTTMGSTKNLISSITLPNGKQWLFEYVHNQGFLTKVTLPSGAYIKYAYVNQGTYGMGWSTGYTPNYGASRADDYIVERRVSADGTSGGEKVWTYTRSQNYVNSTCCFTMMVASPEGSAVEHIFNYQGEEATTKWRVSPTGSVLKTVTNNWVNTSVASNEQPYDPHVTSVTTTLDSGLASTKTINRDSNKNLDYEQTTAYGSSTVVAKKSYTYTSLSLLYGSTPYYTRYLPASETLYGLDPSTSSTTLVQYGYKTYAYDGDSSFGTTHSSVTNHTGSTTASGRGNLTSVKVYSDSTHYLETQTHYDNLGNVISTTDPLGHSTTTSYANDFCTLDTSSMSTLPCTSTSHSSAYAYPTSVTAPLTSTTTATASTKYDFNTGLPTVVTNARGNSTKTVYELMSRVSLVREAAISSVHKDTTYEYDDTNLKTTKQVTVSSGNVGHVETYFDGLYRTVKTVTNDPGGAIVVDAVYDDNGRVKKTSNPYPTGTSSGNIIWTQTNYDGLSRPLSVVHDVSHTSDDSEVSYAYTNNVTTTTDQAGNQRRYTYNILGQLTQVEEPNPTLATAAVTTYKYYVFGPVYQSSQSSQTRTWVYNWLGQMTSQTLPESGTTSFTYDSAGRLGTKTDARSIVTTMAYDYANRLTQRSYSDSTPTVTFTYDGSTSAEKGLRTGMSDGLGSVTYNYDARDRLTSEARSLTGISGTFSTSYGYNIKGDVTQMTYPSGRVINFGYATSGGCCNSRLSSVDDGTTGLTLLDSIAFNAAGGVTSETLNPGSSAITESFTYNNRLQLTQIQALKSSTTVMDFSYDYGSSATNTGRVLSRTDAIQSEHSASYVYDSIYRLQQAYAAGAGSAWSVAWTFDVWGNRTAQTPAGLATSKVGSQTLGYSNNKNTSFTYDSAGNTTNDTVHTYAYNAENQQISMDSTAATYAYDGEGRRMKKYTSSETTYTFYGPGGILCEFTTTNTGATAASSSDKTIYRTSEKTGTAVLLFNTSGTVIENNRSLPYGEAWLSEVASANDKKFTSYDRDKESGLDYAMARMYANNVGRFSSPDQGPIRLHMPTTLNRYTYGNLDPVNNNDPTGNECPAGTDTCVEVSEPPPPDLDLFPVDLKGSPNPCPPDYRGSECGGGGDSGGGGGSSPPKPSPTQANCQSGLRTAQKDNAAVARAMTDKSTLMAAVAGTNIPWTLLAAIGVRESGYNNDARSADGGRGIFQITGNGVSDKDAFNPTFAAQWAANKLAREYAYIAAHHANFTSAQLLQATAAVYNMGLGRNPVGKNIGGNPGRIDIGTAHGNYGGNVMQLMDCFK